MTVVAAIQMVSTKHRDDNLETAARLLKLAAEQGAKLAVLPEVFAVIEDGPIRDYGEREGDPEAPLQQFLASQAKLHRMMIVGGTIPILTRPTVIGQSQEWVEGQRVRAASLVYDENGQCVGRYDKIHLFDVKVDDRQADYSESRAYEPGDEVVCIKTPMGNLGLSVCYDLRFPELYRELLTCGADIITVPSAFTRVTGEAHWEVLLRARAIESQCFVIAAAQGGKHTETRETWGHSMIVDPWGVVLDQWEFNEGIAIAEINLEKLAEIRQRMPVAQHRKL